MKQLAILGGTARFEQPLHVGRPNIGARGSFYRRLEGALDRHWLTNDGPLVREFETRIAASTGARYCIAVANATLGLELTVRALGISGQVIVPAFTFIASVHCLRWLGLEPVFCDVDRETHTISVARMKELISPRTGACLAVHLWGRACSTDQIEQLAAESAIPVIYDAAHAFACTRDKRPLGGCGRASVFSFHATKFVNAFEGGAITTNDEELAGELRRLRNFGFRGYDEVTGLGTNAKMNEACAAMGLTSLDSVDDFINKNRHNHELYARQLRGVEGIHVFPHEEAERCNYQYVVVVIDPQPTAFNRDVLMDVLWAENVRARRYFYPGCHRMEPYRTEQPDVGSRLPVTEWLADRVLCLPTGTGVDDDQIMAICEIIKTAVDCGDEVASASRESGTLGASAG